MSDSPVQVGTTEAGGCVVRIAGRAAMLHSPATEELVVRTLAGDPTTTVAIDLAGCTYLDSTFIGSLVGLYQRSRPAGGGTSDRRGRRVAPPGVPRPAGHGQAAVRRAEAGQGDPRRFGPGPGGRGAVGAAGPRPADSRELSRHVMECHRRLAQTDTPARAAFTKIADAMEAELARG
jgi:hypothetical protein